ncbi:hypothetical protein [Cryobacterium suzukii]|uniref:mannitol dehydrogenase family protein n=1 Tax=Cryobacterium suzukii TaxID=1259198 RepID=UPI00141AEC1E|nr:hypothetical protein [Cryobacterium suzukii]
MFLRGVFQPALGERDLERGALHKAAAAVLAANATLAFEHDEVVASWARYAEGTDEQGEPIDVVDRIKDTVMQSAADYRADPHSFLRDRDLFGDLIDDAAFVAAYDRALHLLHTVGARRTLEVLTASLD